MQYKKFLLFSRLRYNAGSIGWKTAVQQMVIMLDELDKDNKLALLAPVMKRAGSTSSSFAYSPLVAVLGERLPV